MHVWNVLHAARWKYRMQKSPFWHYRTTLSGCIFAAETCIDNRKKTCEISIPPPQRELRATNGWDLLASLGHPWTFKWVSHLGSVTVRHSSSGREPRFAALNRGRHLYSAGWPSCWALAHILVYYCVARNLLISLSVKEFWKSEFDKVRGKNIVKEAYLYSVYYMMLISKALRYGTC